MIQYDGRSYSTGDVLAAIDIGIGPRPRRGEATMALKARGNGKDKARVVFQDGGGGGRRDGRGKYKARGGRGGAGDGHTRVTNVTTASNRYFDSGEDNGASIKTKYCAPRSINLIVNKYRDSFMALTETKPSRGALDSGAVRGHNRIWQCIR